MFVCLFLCQEALSSQGKYLDNVFLLFVFLCPEAVSGGGKQHDNDCLLAYLWTKEVNGQRQQVDNFCLFVCYRMQFVAMLIGLTMFVCLIMPGGSECNVYRNS